MKSSIWRTHENCEGSISLTRRIRNSKKPSRMLVRNLKTRLACILEAGEYHCRIIMKTILQEKETIHYNMFIPMPQSMKMSSSKGSGGQGMGKIGEIFGVEPDESQK